MTQESVFGKYLDVDRQRQKMRELQPGRMLDSVYMQFKDDYQKWKAKQPEVIPPDSQGWTDENLEFLEKHYSGNAQRKGKKLRNRKLRSSDKYERGSLCDKCRPKFEGSVATWI